MKIYLANSITQATEEFKNQMLAFRKKLQEEYEVLEYFGSTLAEAGEVYEHDINCVKNCDMVLAEVTYPSTGVGIEMATALSLGKKVIAVAKEEALVTRMVIGITHPNFKFFRYQNTEELFKLLKE
jgi:2'-deoxynucleoside 5'-phosphate N-hydrolase